MPPLSKTSRTSSRSSRAWRWVIAIFLIVCLLIGIASFFIDESFRKYAERQLTQRVAGYTFHIGALDFHPVGLSLDLVNVRVIQNDHPDPPVAELAKWHASIHWRELLSGHLVSDHWIDDPVIHFTRPQAAKEVQDDSPSKKQWQEAILAIYPLQINEFAINHGDITYRENATSKPLHISELNFRAGNIRNIRSRPQQYPSTVQIDAVIFDRGRFHLDGGADFLAEPTMAFNADLSVTDLALADLLPLTAQHQVHLSQGMLSAEGHLEYAPTVQQVRFKALTVRDVKGDFVHAAETHEKEKKTGRKVAEAADQAANHATLLLRIDHGNIENSEFGFVNNATDPPYRVFITRTDIELENWSNQLSEGTALVKLKGMFMGNGATQISGAFRPETKSPDFDLSVKIVKTQVNSLNQLLRAYGGIDVAAGVFSVYSEMTVKNGTVNGYLKPLFKDVKAYDPEQDQDKGLLQKIYEKTINVAADLLKNTTRGEVATKADLSGPVENPQASTWQMVVTLLQNAFFDAILPGLERGLPKR
jgi:hypothetical protein